MIKINGKDIYEYKRHVVEPERDEDGQVGENTLKKIKAAEFYLNKISILDKEEKSFTGIKNAIQRKVG